MWMKRIPLAAALIATAISLGQDASTPPRRRVAVLGFKNLRNDPNSDWVGAVTAETLATKLARLRSLLLVERDQIDKVLQEQRLQQTDLTDPKQAVQVGRLLGAHSVVVGSFVVAKDQVRFNVRVVDVASGEVLDGDTLGGSEADIMNLPVRLAEQVVRSLSAKVVGGAEQRVTDAAPVKLSPEEERNLAERPTANAEAYEAYGRGVEMSDKNRWREAQAEFEKATRLDPSFGLAWTELGVMHLNQGAWPQAIECHEKAEEIFRAASDEKNLAVALKNLGNVYRSQGRYPEAMRLFDQALAMSRRLGEDPDVAKSLNNIGMVHEKQGRYEEAMRSFEESLAIKRRIGDEPGAARTISNMANVHYRQGRYDEAMKLFEESLAMRRRLGDEPGMAGSLCGIAMVCARRKAYGEAMARYDEALAIYRRLGDEPSIAQLLNNIGVVYKDQARYNEAVGLFGESLAIRRRLGDEPGVAQSLYNMAVVYKARKEYAKALPPAREAQAIARRLGIPLAADCDKVVTSIETALGR